MHQAVPVRVMQAGTMGAVAGKERKTDNPTRLRVWTTSCEEDLEELFLVLKTWASLEHTTHLPLGFS